MDDLNHKLNNIYSGKVVRKDLTKRIKEGANVPVYVLEYLLGMYCATDDEVTIEEGVTRVKNILARLIPLCENNYNCCELGPVPLENPTFTKKFPQTRFWFPVVKPQ